MQPLAELVPDHPTRTRLQETLRALCASRLRPAPLQPVIPDASIGGRSVPRHARTRVLVGLGPTRHDGQA